MPTVEESILIERDRDDVWGFIADPDNATMWQSNVTRFEVKDGGELREGAEIEGVTRLAGKDIEWTSTITDYQPQETWTFRSLDAPMDFEGTYRVEEAGDATRVTFRLESKNLGGFFGKLADPVVTRMYGRDVKASLGNLKEIMESEPDT
jgi:uncharacterized membrane protein